MQEINLVQGFRGSISYLLNFDGKDIDISNVTSVLFNFTDRRETLQQSIRCKQGSAQNEAIIPFTTQLTGYGDYFGEFVIKNGSDVSIYPITDRIPLHVRKRIQV